MKQKIIILSVFLLPFCGYAQLDKKVILERLKSELLSKTDDYSARERYVVSFLETRMEWENDNCDIARDFIKKFYAMNQKERDEAPIDYIGHIGSFQCKEAYDFLETQIKNSPSEKERCSALTSLVWTFDADYLSCIFDYAKRDVLSVQEKLSIATAYTVLGIYASNSELKDEAIKLLDEVCYNSPKYSDVEHDCIWTFYKLGGKPAIDFINAWGERIGGWRKISAAVFIAEMGEYETTFPIFEEAIHSEDIDAVAEAIDGLAVIGTEEAIHLIEKQTNSENEIISKRAQEALRKLEKGRGKQCKN